MALQEPTFDARGYRELLNEALARIPVHNPEWTNFTDSDPGITVLQLFAFLSESVIYRAGLIPERNRKKFLSLLGDTRRAAAPATGIVTFSNPQGPLPTVSLASGRSLRAGDVPFETANGLGVLAIESKPFFKERLQGEEEENAREIFGELYASFERDAGSLAFYETKTLEVGSSGTQLPALDLAKTVDGSLWMALLARDPAELEAARAEIAGQPITLGVMPALDADGCVLYPTGRGDQDRPALRFEVPNVVEGAPPGYRTLTPRTEQTLLREPAIVELNLPAKDETTSPPTNPLILWTDVDPLEAGTGEYPPSLEDSDDQDRLITWIRIRAPETGTETAEEGSQQVRIVLSWVGLNAALISQRSHVAAEILPVGTGQPDQTAQLANGPVIKESVTLSVNGELWEQIDDLRAAGPEVPQRSPRLASEEVSADTTLVKAFAVDDDGVVRCGNGVNGARWPRGALVQVSYDYGGGDEGNVGIGKIKTGDLPAGLEVVNPIPTWGADRGETLEEAEARIPQLFVNRDRIVTTTDAETIAAATPGVAMGRVEAIALLHPDQPDQTSEGVFTTMVIPENDPLHPNAPRPDTLFLETVCAHLEPRRMLTTELHVRGPVYVPIYVSVAVEAIPGRALAVVIDAVRAAIENFLSPLSGGFEEEGWVLGKAVEAAELRATAARVSGVASVVDFVLATGDGAQTDSVTLVGLELPELVGLSVAPNELVAIDELIGTGAEGDAVVTTEALTPVPVVPEEC